MRILTLLVSHLPAAQAIKNHSTLILTLLVSHLPIPTLLVSHLLILTLLVPHLPAAQAVHRALTHTLPMPAESAHSSGTLPSVADVSVLLAPACVRATRGALLPLEHSAKQRISERDTPPPPPVTMPTACNASVAWTLPEGGGARSGESDGEGGGGDGGHALGGEMGGPGEVSSGCNGGVSVSFDLATGVALDMWYRMLRQYRAHVAELWSQSARQWDNGKFFFLFFS